MRLLESIVATAQRGTASAADTAARATEFATALPLIVLTCIDPRLNPLVPRVLGLPEESFIWLRNAGNLITGPLSSTLRSLALAGAVKGGREIAIIGHTDCQVCKTTMLQLTERFRALGVDRAQLPENLVEFFGLSASERNNVLRATEHVRSSPLIGPRVPVHGLLLDLATARLEWVVNGYQTLETQTSTRPATPASSLPGPLPDAWAKLGKFEMGEMKNSTDQIGEVRTTHSAPSAPALPRLPDPAPKAAPTPPGLRDLPTSARYSVKADDGKIYGPFTADMMLGWLADGRITLDTPTQPLGRNDWKPLATFLTKAPSRPGGPPPIIRH